MSHRLSAPRDPASESGERKNAPSPTQCAALLEAIDDPAFVHDRAFRLVYANPAYLARAGVDLDAALGRPYWTLFPPGDGPLPQCRMAHARSDETAAHDYIELPDGEVLLSRGYPLGEYGIRLLISSKQVCGEFPDSLLRHALRERTKELQGLFTVSALAGDAELDLATLLQQTVEALPPAWQHPEVTCARIRFQGAEYRSQGFAESEWVLTAPLGPEGSIEVFYTEGRPTADEGPFLKEERALLEAVAAQLRIAIRQRRDRHALAESDRSLRHRVELETLLADIAAAFIDLAPERLDWMIEQALRRFGEFVGVDRAYLFQLSGDDTMSNTHEWCRAGIEPQREKLQAVPVDTAPWWMGRLRKDRAINVTVSELPPQAKREKAVLEKQGIKSVCVVPLWSRSALAGFLGLDWVRSPGAPSVDDVRLLRIGAQVLGDALERCRVERRLLRANRALRVKSRWDAAVVQANDERALFEAVCRCVVEGGGYAMAWVGYAEADRTLRVAASAGDEFGFLTRAVIARGDDPAGVGPVGRAIKTGELQVSRDLHSDSSVEAWREAAVACGFRSKIALPLRFGEEVFGALAIYSQEPDAFDDEELDLLRELAADLSFGVHALRSRFGRDQAELELQLKNRAIEAARNGIMLVDATRPGLPITYVNPAFETITGYSRDEVLGRNPLFLSGEDTDQIGLREIGIAIRDADSATAVLRNYRKDGSLFWNELYVAPVRDEADRLTHFVGVISDVTERQQYQEQLEYQAQHDALTGLPNRNLLRDRIDQAIIYADRHDRTVAVLFLDLDRFKVVNDSLGHPAGDELLRQLARRLSATIRRGDTVARHGGDEFVVVLSDVAHEREVEGIAREMLAEVNRPIQAAGREFFISASIGVSLFPRDGKDADRLLQYADTAMHRAKETGRGNVEFFTAELNARMLERLTLEVRLKTAIEKGELLLHYQPQVRLRDGRLSGLEALVRWRHPELGLLAPGRFVPLAEETGLIMPLGEWVLRTACRQNRHWQDAKLADLPVAVNLSVRQLEQDDLPERIAAILEETGLKPHFLELEVTESALIADPDGMLNRLERIRELGCKLSLDDFGTGYSSLSYLKRFPFDRLKIDQSFVADITTQPQDAAIAKTIIAMARTLGMEVLAEGVETEAQLNYLQKNDCDIAQGFFLSHPEPAEEIENLLSSGRIGGSLAGMPEGEQPSLLVIDDELNMTRALKRLLRRDGYQVLTTNNPLDAFDLLANNNVHVILSDQRMPEMTGTELLSRVKELYPDIVRIVLSGYTELSTVTEAVNKGWIYKFLTKPWDDNELRAQIREAFERYQRNRTERH